ncbi:hypothetical protein D3C71_1636820 [compost metagenome]
MHALGLAHLVVEHLQHSRLQAMGKQGLQRAQRQVVGRARVKPQGQAVGLGKHLLVEPLGIPQRIQISTTKSVGPALGLLGIARRQVLVDQLAQLELDRVFKEELQGKGVLRHEGGLVARWLDCCHGSP